MHSPFDAVSETVAQRCRWYRQNRGLTRHQLAELCTAHGSDLTFAAITSIETGRRDPATGRRRRSVTVDELFTLARALKVPPVALLVDVDHGGQTATIQPGVDTDAWRAVQWISGEAPIPLINSEEDWNRYGAGDYDERTGLYEFYDLPAETQPRAPGRPTGTAVDLLRAHAQLFAAWWASRNRAIQARRDGHQAKDPDIKRIYKVEADAEDRQRKTVLERDLRAVRAEMARNSLQPPDLPEEMEHLHEPKGRRK